MRHNVPDFSMLCTLLPFVILCTLPVHLISKSVFAYFKCLVLFQLTCEHTNATVAYMSLSCVRGMVSEVKSRAYGVHVWEDSLAPQVEFTGHLASIEIRTGSVRKSQMQRETNAPFTLLSQTKIG